MDAILDLSRGEFLLFLMVFFRVTGIMMLAPILGNPGVPVPVKIFLSLMLAVIFFPLVDRSDVVVAPSVAAMAGAALSELSVGLLIGFAAAMIFAAVQFGGHVIDQELGLLFANMVDPLSSQQTAVVGQFKVLVAMLVYVVIDGHHFLVAAVLGSFDAVPLLGIRITEGAVLHLSDTLMTDLLRMGVQIAAPALVTLFLITVALAFMARTVPEMNVFILGFAVRIAVGFLVLLVGVGLFVYGFREFHLDHAGSVEELIRRLGGSE